MEKKQIVCEVCGEVVPEDRYRRHINNGHKDKKEWRCDLCLKEFTSNYNLQYHIAHHINARAFVCTVCPNAYNTQADLAQHFRTHEKHLDPYKCEVCGLLFDTRSKFNTHMRTHKVDQPKERKECPECGKLVLDVKGHHETVHLNIRRHECDACHKRFHKKSHLDRHFTMVHDPQKNDICDICGKAFGEKSLLRKHKARHASNQLTFYCPVCKKHIAEIKSHYEEVHMDLPHVCEHCHRRFRKKREYDNHISSQHTKIRKWMCDLCGKRFVKKYQVKRHLQSHINVNGLTVEDVNKIHPIFLEDGQTEDIGQKLGEFKFEDFKEDDFQSDSDGYSYEGHDEFGATSETDIFANDSKMDQPELIESMVDPITIKQEPEDTYEIAYVQSPGRLSIKSERISDNDEIAVFDPDIKASIKEESDDEFTGIESMVETHFGIEIKCNACQIVFDSKETFRTHFMITHFKKSHQKPSYPCKRCGETFEDKQLLRKHYRNKHYTKFPCEECTTVFSTKTELKKHKRAEHGAKTKGPIQCKICEKVWKNERSLSIHMHASHSGDPLQCTICGMRFPYKQAMYRHRDREHSKKTHNCDQCPQQCATKHELRLHKEHHHNANRKNASKDYMCTICGVFFPNSWVLPHHRRTVHGDQDPDIIRECHICKEVMRDLYLKRKHMAQVHLNGKKLKRNCGYCKADFDLYEDFKAHIESHVGIFICFTCGEFFFDDDGLKTHIRTHRTIDSSMKKYICDHCGHRLFTKRQLKLHMVKHMEESETHYCDICGKGFKFASSLYTHRKYHGEGEFVCTYCGKKFARNSDLVIHIRKHTNEKPFRCEICDRAFSLKVLLQSHQQTHPETRVLFKCKLCEDQVFIDKKQLGIHEIEVHPELRPYRCFVCDVSFKFEHHLRKHNKSKHF